MNNILLVFKSVTPAGFKPATFCSVVRCSIQLSYGALLLKSECKGNALF